MRLRASWPDPRTVDWILAVVLTAGLEADNWLTAHTAHERTPTAVLGAVVTIGVGFRRRYPATVGVTAGLVAVVLSAVWAPPNLIAWGIAWLCCMYALAAWATPRRFAVGLTVVILAALASAALPSARASSTVQFAVATLAVMLLIRRVIGDREQRALMAERERDVAAREAVVEERARIARELHDSVAGNVSLIVVQAGAERRVLDEASSTRDVLATIEGTGRRALTEMRRLTGLLRSDPSDELAPPRLADLPALVDHVQEAGLPVALEVEGDRRPLPAGLETAAYRIVQEALTNALKHAGEARATVVVRYAPELLELEVADDGPGVAEPAPGSGHGLVGMRERVAPYGGRVDAGSRPGGGFAVRVLLPTR